MISGRAPRRSGWRGTLVIAALAIVYALVVGGWRAGRRHAFDPLAAEPHAVERLIVAGRFADALPQVEALRRRYPGEWLLTMWLARAHEGLGHWQPEAAAWEEFVRESPSPSESCPSLPRAYERAGEAARALAAYERCTRFDPSDPGPFTDLGAAYMARGRMAAAAAAYRAALDLAPDDPAVRQRLASLAGPPSDAVVASERQP